MGIIELDMYEFAKSVEDQATSFLEKGEFALVYRARKLTQAKSAWDNLRKLSLNDLESPERADAGTACVAFDKEWDSYAERCTKKASGGDTSWPPPTI